MASTPLRNLRVDDDLWTAFGEAAAAVGTTRTEALVGFMRRFTAAMSPTADGRSADTDQGVDVSRSAP